MIKQGVSIFHNQSAPTPCYLALHTLYVVIEGGAERGFFRAMLFKQQVLEILIG